MTEKQKRRLLKHLKHKKLKRSEIKELCMDDARLDYDCEIESLCAKKMINMISEPVLKNGVFKPNPNDLFKIGDTGKDYLADVKRDYMRTYLPISISFLSLVTAVIALIVSITC